MMPALARPALRVLVSSMLAVAPLSAGINRWTPVGPPGGNPGTFAVAPSAPGVVYLGCVYSDCNEGIFRSDDGGVHWHQQGPFGYLVGLIVDPQDAETLFAPIDVSNEAGTFSLGVVKSTDGGATWKRADQGLDSSDCSFVTPNLAFAGAGRLLVPTDHGIYETVDGGASWHLQSLAGVGVLLLATDPLDSSHWFASTGDVLETHDAGRSWSSTNFTLGTPVQMLFADHCLYALTYYQISYATTVSFFRRVDGGAWQPIPFLPSGVRPTAIAASPAGILYLATTLGAYRSTDRGATWRPSAVSASRSTVRPSDSLVDVTVVPGSPDSVLASGYFEIWRSGDAGTTWQPSDSGIDGNQFEALAVASDSTVYTAVSLQGVFRSRDRGRTWRKRTAGLPLGPPTTVDFTISALATDPRDPARAYAALWLATSATVLLAQTTDAGDHWQYSQFPAPAGTAQIRTLQVDPASSESLYAIADVDTIVPAVLHSFDGGKSWSRLLTDPNQIFSLAIDPHRTTTLYVGTFDRFLKSMDGGRSWQQAGRGLPPGAALYALGVDPQDSRRLYAAPLDGGVYVSNDEGKSFRPMDRGLPAGTSAYQLVVDPRRSVLYLLDPGHGIFRWLPEAQSWTMVEDGLPPRFRDSSSYLFAIDPARPDVLYAGGQYGLFQLTVR
jgi:photosystem II stability/assembly factor-like uncharacterized protein